MGGFNKTVIPLALVGYDMVIAGADYFPSKGSNRLLVIANSTLAPCWLCSISYPTRTRGIIVKYILTSRW